MTDKKATRLQNTNGFGRNYKPETDAAKVNARERNEDLLQVGRRRRRIEDILEASRLDEGLDWD